MIRLTRQNFVVFQDTEFTWAHSVGSPNSRTITHNRNQVSDKIFISVLYLGNWQVANALYYVNGTGFYGYRPISTGIDSEDKNKERIEFYGTFNGTSLLCRIRLYWYTNTDLNDSSGGFFR
jgi:hypothetical protein